MTKIIKLVDNNHARWYWQSQTENKRKKKKNTKMYRYEDKLKGNKAWILFLWQREVETQCKFKLLSGVSDVE